MKCKFYSDYIKGFGCNACMYVKKEYNIDFLESCNYTHNEENCVCFKPLEGRKEQLFAIGNSVSNQDLVCSDCERVIFIGKKLGNVAELDANNISKIESIEVNGNKFKKV